MHQHRIVGDAESSAFGRGGDAAICHRVAQLVLEYLALARWRVRVHLHSSEDLSECTLNSFVSNSSLSGLHARISSGC